MNRVEELIERLCPDGVVYKRLGEVCTFNRGKSLSSGNAKTGNVPVISGGKKPAFYHDTANRKENTITIAGSGAYAGYVSFWKQPVFCADSFSVDITNTQILDVRYLYHFLLLKQNVIYSKKSGAGIPHVYGKDVAKITIPLPPLEVQNEIVSILDNFSKLEAELEAELEARKQQYEYYRDTLLTFDDSIPWKSLEEEFSFIRNGFVGTVTPYFTSKESGVRYLQGTNIHNGIITDNEEFYITTDFHKKHIKNELKEDDIIMVQSGHVGESAVVGEKYKGSNCHALIIMSNSRKNCNSKFVNYYFQSTDGKKKLNAISTGGTLKHILSSKMKKFKIPVPSLEEQSRIVSILDRFDKLCNDLTEGLPAEIEARRKQYEYYRDRLLTFKPKETECPA